VFKEYCHYKGYAKMIPKKKYIHVNMHKIRANKKHGTNEPVITIKEGRKNTYCHKVSILGPSEVIYGGNDKALLSCGARVVIVTESELKID
tara:strand:+ start:474 stop:746 length:273 start_codon:yes stop_codon:yes gene_type:complete